MLQIDQGIGLKSFCLPGVKVKSQSLNVFFHSLQQVLNAPAVRMQTTRADGSSRVSRRPSVTENQSCLIEWSKHCFQCL